MGLALLVLFQTCAEYFCLMSPLDWNQHVLSELSLQSQETAARLEKQGLESAWRLL